MVGLLQDSLAMPFTIFTTPNKLLMLRWLAALQGEGKGDGIHGALPVRQLICLDVTREGFACLLLEDGTTREDVRVPSDVCSTLREALARGEEVVVSVRGGDARAGGEFVSWCRAED